MKTLVTTSSFGKADSRPLDLLTKYCDVILNPYGRKISTDEFIDLSADVDAVIAGVENITAEAIEKRQNIKVISRCGVGMDSIDAEACKKYGIRLFNTPNAPVDSVAELTVTVMLDILKNVSNMNSSMKAGNWNKMTGFMLKGKKVGIIGMGRIGSRVSELISAFDVEIGYTDIVNKNCPYRFMYKDELLGWADIISIHTSTCNEGEYIIGENDIDLMKKSAFLINTSRGRFIDENALFVALKSKRLMGAALDVFENEPYNGNLLSLDNVILTPHISSSAKEGRALMELEAVYNLLNGLGIEYDKVDNI